MAFGNKQMWSGRNKVDKIINFRKGTTRRESAETGGLFMKQDYHKDLDILIELGGG
jgi:hypothetical protein